MNATKRKFNTLVNGIGNKSNTTLSSPNSKDVNNVASDSGDLQAKKRRVSDKSVTSDAPSTTVSSIRNSIGSLKHKKAASTATPSEAPKYAPWDREAFLKRLKSFSNLTDWTPKPARVNEVEWAKRGWVCQKQERVRCCLCHVEILVKLNKKEVEGKEEAVYVAEKIEEALVDRYVELIVLSHDEGCLWRQRGCDDTIFKLPLNKTGTTFANLKERYDELDKRSATLPYSFNIRTPAGFDIDAIIKQLPPSFSTRSSEGPAKINQVALTMALFGWQGHTHDRLGPQMGSASCHACYRILGFWIFKSKQINEAGDEVVAPAMNCLDVIKEHRDYCPWQNAMSQNGAGAVKTSTTGMAGWEIIMKILQNDHLLRVTGNGTIRNVVKALVLDDAEMDGDSGMDTADNDARSIRDEEDKKRWARLRRVKSLFESRNGKKIPSKKNKV